MCAEREENNRKSGAGAFRSQRTGLAYEILQKDGVFVPQSSYRRVYAVILEAGRQTKDNLYKLLQREIEKYPLSVI